MREREVLLAVRKNSKYIVYESMGLLPESHTWIEWLKLSMQQHIKFGKWSDADVFEDVMYNNKCIPTIVDTYNAEHIPEGVTILEFEQSNVNI